MNINFNSNTSKTKNEAPTKGSFEDMIKMRSDNQSDVEKSIQDVLKDYDGTMIAIIRLHEDENGDPDSETIFIGGTSHLENQVKFASILRNGYETFMRHMVESCSKDPTALRKVMDFVLKDMQKKLKED